MRFEFVIRSGKETGRTVVVETGQTISLGRLKRCDVVVDDEAASRRHCTITGRDDVCVVADLQSANGTFVNEERIETIELQKGDTIRVGLTVLELTDAAAIVTPVGSVPASAIALNIVDERSKLLVQRTVDPTKLEFLAQVYKRKDEAHILDSAQKYLTTLHKVSDVLSRASSVEALFDSIVQAILDVTGGDRAAVLIRNSETAVIDMVSLRTRDGNTAGEVRLSRTVVNDTLEKGISSFTDDAIGDDLDGEGEPVIGQGIRSVMCAPMRTTDRILGVLYVDSQMAREFNESELELLAAVGHQAGIALHRATLLQEAETLFVDVMKAIASMIDAKDGYTHKHSERVAAFGVRLGRHLGFDAGTLAVVELSALLHDIGKIGVPDVILHKPGKLTEEELKEMRMHTVHGARILSNIQSEKIASLLPGVKYHHERWDGKGYPEGLTAEQIPLLGRVLGVADFLDALTSIRSYRQGCLTLDEAVLMVQDLAGQAFDPMVAKAAVELHLQGELALPSTPNSAS